MKFELNEYHRNTTDKQLLDDISRVANILGKIYLTKKDYSKFGRYHSSTFERRFGSWSNALTSAGLKTQAEANNYCSSLSNFITDVKETAGKLNCTSLTICDYKRFGNYDIGYFRKHSLSWNDILNMAGLDSTPFRIGYNNRITNEELFADIERVWIKLGRQPTVTDLKEGHFKFGQNTFSRRFGGWRGALNAFIDYINNPTDTKLCESSESIINQDNKDTTIIETEHEIYKHKTRREPNLRLRFKVMYRDGFKCCLCGRSRATDCSVELVLDHIYPWAKGGETTYENLQTLCKECNLGKSDLVNGEYNN